MSRKATASDTIAERTNKLTTSARSLRPRACAVMPLVPIRRNPNTQYTRLKIMEPTATAPI